MKVYGFDESKCKEEVVGKNTDLFIITHDFNRFNMELDANGGTGGLTYTAPDDFNFSNLVHVGTTRTFENIKEDGTIGRFYPINKCQGNVDVTITFNSTANQIQITLTNNTDKAIQMAGILRMVFLKYA